MTTMVKLLRASCLALAAVLACPAALAQDDRGPYLVLAGGRAHYEHDCSFFSSCDSVRATTGKVLGGWRFGVFALEVWAVDFGKAELAFGDSLRLRGAGVSGAWYLHFGSGAHGVLRAGVMDMQQRRGFGVNTSSTEGSFGLGAMFELMPALSVELAWDMTTATGRSSGSVLANAVTAGLRVRF